MKKGRLKYIYYIFFTISILYSCSPKVSYQVQSFFFDGVPDYLEGADFANDSTLFALSEEISDSLKSKQLQNTITFHQPYSERDCAKCHNRNQMGKLRLKSPELCYTCHIDFNNIYTIVHAPVVSGACSECHQPHQSKIKGLLRQPEQELCISCHVNQFTNNNSFHKKVEDRDCSECHNPHGGKDRFMLESVSCYDCHENYEEKFEFVHGPVDARKCDLCHTNHDSKLKNLLIKSGDELCLDCHNDYDIFPQVYHKNTEGRTCITCHNPHSAKADSIYSVAAEKGKYTVENTTSTSRKNVSDLLKTNKANVNSNTRQEKRNQPKKEQEAIPRVDDKGTHISKTTIKEEHYYWQIQIAALKTEKATSLLKEKYNLEDSIYLKEENGMYKYSFGNFNSYTEAKVALRNYQSNTISADAFYVKKVYTEKDVGLTNKLRVEEEINFYTNSVSWKIQIAKLKLPISKAILDYVFTTKHTINMHYDNQCYIYTFGDYPNINQAKIELQRYVLESGNIDAVLIKCELNKTP